MVERLWVGAVLVGYLAGGGLLFHLLEPAPGSPRHPNPAPPPPPAAAYHNPLIAVHTENCLNQLWTITERLNVLYERNWTRLVTEQLRQFESNVIQAVKLQGVEPVDNELHWSFTGSILYSLTVITTIGCGNFGPRSVEGKLATMVYALIGVPLMLVCLSQLGSLLAEGIQTIYSFLYCCKHKSPHERTEYQLEERGGARSTLVVGMGSGRPVCKLTSVESSLCDYSVGGGNTTAAPTATHRLHNLNHHHPPPQLHHTHYRNNHHSHSHDSDDEETDTSRCGASNETPSRMPLIWRGGGSGGARPPTPPPARGSGRSPVAGADSGESGSEAGRRRGPCVPAVVPLLLVVGYLGLGAWLWATWQGSSYLDGLYFAFTALTTIGLGELRSAPDQLHLLALSFYLLFGLVLVATSFALLQEQVLSKTRRIATTLGVMKKERLPV